MSLREQHDLYLKKIKELKKLGMKVTVIHNYDPTYFPPRVLTPDEVREMRKHFVLVDIEGKKHTPKYFTTCIIHKNGNTPRRGGDIVTHAFCCPRDTPNRKLGWSIAVGRALKRWEENHGKLAVK